MTSGFTGYQVIQSLKRAYPDLAQNLTHLQIAGYTGGQILSMLKKGKGQKVKDEDFFEDSRTEHEKTMDNDRRNKSKALKQGIGIAATAATLPLVGLKAYQALKAGQSAMTVLPAQGARQAAQGAGTTLNVFQKGLPNQQKQIPYQQGQLPYGGGQLPFSPGQPPQPNPQGPPAPGAPSAPIGDVMQSVDLVKNLRHEGLIESLIRSGYPLEQIAMIARSSIKDSSRKGNLKIFDKVPGGLEKVIQDYAQYMQSNPPQQRQFAPPTQEQMPQEPQAMPEQMQQPAQAPQVSPAMQRLQGLMQQSKAARQPQAPVAPQQPISAPPEPIEEAPIVLPEKIKPTKPTKPTKKAKVEKYSTISKEKKIKKTDPKYLMSKKKTFNFLFQEKKKYEAQLSTSHMYSKPGQFKKTRKELINQLDDNLKKLGKEIEDIESINESSST